MKNQFRNDGEMPPEMAAQFPVIDRGQIDKEDVKPKTKRTAPECPEETPASLDFFTTLVCFVAAALVWMSGEPEAHVDLELYNAAITFFVLLGLYFVGNGLGKLGQ